MGVSGCALTPVVRPRLNRHSLAPSFLLRMRQLLILLFALATFSACAASRPTMPKSAPAPNPAPVHVLRAVENFQPVNAPAFAASYVETRASDPTTHGRAVNPKMAQERFAAAETVFAGLPGRYAVRLETVAEEDGESVYEFVIDGRSVGRRINPRVAEKRMPTTHCWENVVLRPGMSLRILFAGRSNRLVREADGFAWSRGRWRALALIGPLTQ